MSPPPPPPNDGYAHRLLNHLITTATRTSLPAEEEWKEGVAAAFAAAAFKANIFWTVCCYGDECILPLPLFTLMWQFLVWKACLASETVTGDDVAEMFYVTLKLPPTHDKS